MLEYTYVIECTYYVVSYVDIIIIIGYIYFFSVGEDQGFMCGLASYVVFKLQLSTNKAINIFSSFLFALDLRYFMHTVAKIEKLELYFTSWCSYSNCGFYCYRATYFKMITVLPISPCIYCSC